MDNAHSKETREVKCTLEGSSGDYEERKIVHAVRHRDQVIVIDHVPAEVCPVCGDVLLKPGTVSLYEYA